MDMQLIERQTRTLLTQLLEVSQLAPHALLVVGCSTSRVTGYKIGKHSSEEVAACLFDTIHPILGSAGIHLAVQCCEHLNRAIVLEGAAARLYGLDIVRVVPRPHAGGAMAACAFERLADAVVVENIRAVAGMDIGGTMIGMHLKPVAVPIHFDNNVIGHASVICARTRPKYIGGPRAAYPAD